ncbi:hypothetical protein FVEN_g12828 [Fusarium venenatum]|uniref:uncharacterized protein n=1 Tax=Fusarium venenatum TaxID=56646 RepID=UPI001D56942E|nr:hypothetical protein FVEN_g12828 [Fusarium venenatum]KAH7003143.1 hypothetical protein EDB82DRAFT_519194 [Fusarium venenatum]
MLGSDPHGGSPTPGDHSSLDAAQSVDNLAGHSPRNDYAVNLEAHHYNQLTSLTLNTNPTTKRA